MTKTIQLTRNDIHNLINETIKRVINEEYENDNNPKIYVSTYGKYNNGSLKGEWVDLTDFDSKEEFYEYCNRLHNDEGEYQPELMFQDWENIPNGMVGESFISDHMWEYIEYDGDNDIKEAVMNYCQGDWDRFQNAMENMLVFEGCHSMSDVAAQCIDEQLISDETKKLHFDYEGFGRDYAIDWSGEDENDTIYASYGVDEDDDYSLGEEIINELYGDDIPEDLLERYIDYDGLGRDLEIEWTFIEYPGGYIEIFN